LLLPLSLLYAVRTDTEIYLALELEPGSKYGPYANGTAYHTRVISKSKLIGEVDVEGGGVYFTANGYNTENLKNVFIDQRYSFTVDPADDLYTFTFDNAASTARSSIRFALKERWVNILLLVPSFIGFLALVPTGLALFLTAHRKMESTDENLRGGP